MDHMKQHPRPQSLKGLSWEGSTDCTGSTGSGSCHTLHTVAAETQGQNQNQNQNELYWPGMFTHTRNLL